MLETRNIDKECLSVTVRSIEEVLSETLSEDSFKYVLEYLEEGEAQLLKPLSVDISYINKGNPDFDIAHQYLDLVLNGKRNDATKLILDSVEEGFSIKKIFLNVFQPVQREIGRLWQTNKISVAQEHYCTAVTQMIVSQLYPYIFQEEKNGYILVATCIGGELHELGVRMVADFFEMNNWDTYYLGANTPIQSIIETIINRKANLLAISATMSKHISEVTKLIQQIRQTEVKDIKIIVGGYPFNLIAKLWKEVGADGFARDALNAVKIGEELVGVVNTL
ncbi:MAG: cobalamin-binding protein [Candidatus Lokiarchaeota archaeon]|nr:cobalamin-binding protein [Candidatus Lokiarchaeota archaeon]